ncbi:MAG: hypothetical protein A3I66_04315 [Burkholderiales bacterium RIFCSPLOWO2_02_FULL_57_36]|nr:MAG: hypothetical protein A3I66_04315 [Burkholderiales bacterium RIFCSPLOWO2_02_FULL_57_36]
MQTVAIILLLAGIALAAFVGFPLRSKLGKRLGQEDFQAKLNNARKAGDPFAKRLFLVGWASGALVILGTVLLILGRYFQGV